MAKHKININYNELDQTQARCGNFIFIKEDDGRIHNLEARF